MAFLRANQIFKQQSNPIHQKSSIPNQTETRTNKNQLNYDASILQNPNFGIPVSSIQSKQIESNTAEDQNIEELNSPTTNSKTFEWQIEEKQKNNLGKKLINTITKPYTQLQKFIFGDEEEQEILFQQTKNDNYETTIQEKKPGLITTIQNTAKTAYKATKHFVGLDDQESIHDPFSEAIRQYNELFSNNTNQSNHEEEPETPPVQIIKTPEKHPHSQDDDIHKIITEPSINNINNNIQNNNDKYNNIPRPLAQPLADFVSTHHNEEGSNPSPPTEPLNKSNSSSPVITQSKLPEYNTTVETHEDNTEQSKHLQQIIQASQEAWSELRQAPLETLKRVFFKGFSREESEEALNHQKDQQSQSRPHTCLRTIYQTQSQNKQQNTQTKQIQSQNEQQNVQTKQTQSQNKQQNVQTKQIQSQNAQQNVQTKQTQSHTYESGRKYININAKPIKKLKNPHEYQYINPNPKIKNINKNNQQILTQQQSQAVSRIHEFEALLKSSHIETLSSTLLANKLQEIFESLTLHQIENRNILVSNLFKSAKRSTLLRISKKLVYNPETPKELRTLIKRASAQ